MDYRKVYDEWCSNPYFDEKTRKELISIRDNDDEIKDRFFRELEFGTAGLRGVIGAGTNRMNFYTVRKATQGLANFIIDEGGAKKGVAIAFDSRHMSPEFSEAAALCLCANGIRTYLFESLRPTPELSFAVRELSCIAGIVVTASHNPAEYNGYKVYWEDGAQIAAPKDSEIIAEVNAVTDYRTVKTMSRAEAEATGMLKIIGKEIDDKYIKALKKQIIHPDIIKEQGKDLKIVYTPLHGTGNLPVQRVLSELSFAHVYVVPEQEKPDGDFPTVDYPNPEDPKAFALALALAKKVDADVIMATDPDADRLGVYAKDSKTGEYHSFTGNMSGILILEYLMSQRKELKTIAPDGVIIKTIVTTNMTDKVAEAYGVKLTEVLTGFKYIGEQIKLFEKSGKGHYEFGFEESYGCLVGTHARDKDAIVAVMILCEAAAFYRKQGLTLWDQMGNIYKKYGYFKEGLKTMTLKGSDGVKQIQQMMDKIRNNPPKQLSDYQVLAFRDYEKDTVLQLSDGSIQKTGLPKSNVLYFDLTDDAWVCIRPSGTEPKIKFYIGVKGSTEEEAEKRLSELTDALMKLS